MKKNILGLDIGTNSIGWAVVESTGENIRNLSGIRAAGSRIIPMDGAEIGDFDRGNLVSSTAARTAYRSMRRLRERHLLRRERLHRVLNLMGFLPQHYASEIDFEKNYGQFFSGKEPKIAYPINEYGKAEFYFRASFEEMIHDFAEYQPQLIEKGKKIPHDWTIYYLRKKALSRKITKEELAWLILHFNRKRGYYELRGEDADDKKIEEYHRLKVVNVIDKQEKNKKGETTYRIVFENGWEEDINSRVYPEWTGTEREYIVTFTETKDGIKRTFRTPKEDDWKLMKKKTEKEIGDSGKTAGCYIYDTLLSNPGQKIKGKLIQTIDRANYRNELSAIIKKQAEYHPELTDAGLYEKCICDLYRNNRQHRDFLRKKNMAWLIIDDILFYQRPLKSKKSQIAECRYEYREFTVNGETNRKYLKCVPKSHPLFEEFRLWQFLKNVRILRLDDGTDVTGMYLPDEDSYTDLFDKLKQKKEINRKSFFSSIKGAKLRETEYNWNYGDRTLPVCPTHAEFFRRFKNAGVDDNILSSPVEEHLWHILYSVNDKAELAKALYTFAGKYGLPDAERFVSEFAKIKPFGSDYASYSLKAIKKLLVLMRAGKYWNEAAMDEKLRERLDKIIDGEHDENISENVREKVRKELGDNLSMPSFRNLPLWLACHVVYGCHSEAIDAGKWNSPEDIDRFIREFKQHSLRNPIVERIILETLRVVRDIWRQYGHLSEIHIELGREMKSPKDKRVEMTARNMENENTNERIRAILTELKNEGLNVRPDSLSQQEKLKIYEEGVLGANDIPDDIFRISRQWQPANTEIIRYKCWLEQGYRSPYTGEIIPLSRLFTSEYDIEHIIPQARYYDDSFSNKIICESAVNRDKGSMLACEYIRQCGGKRIELGTGEQVTLLTFDTYQESVKRSFRNSPFKKKKLLMDEIPDAFIERQMNDTRYISRYVMGLLSNIVREEGEQEATSKNILPVTGKVTSKLKEDWGLNDVWNKLIVPRFIRLNQLSGSEDYGYYSSDGRFKITVPEKYRRGFTKKRIDHRHHAMDAIAIACATCLHINYLNNESAKSGNIGTRETLRSSLCTRNKQGKWLFDKPWHGFTVSVITVLENTVVSFRNEQRIINKSVNKYLRYENGEKKIAIQAKGENIVIRKPLHKETVYGKVSLQYKKTVGLSAALDNWKSIAGRPLRKKIEELVNLDFDKKQILAYFKKSEYQYEGKDVSKADIYYYAEGKDAKVASRKPLDKSFDVKKIQTVTDSGIRQILTRHMEKYNNKPEEAFSADGIADMNKNIVQLNNGKFHKPVYKVRVAELLGNKFNVGIKGNKKAKYVEAAQGTNLFFAVYESADGKRTFETIPLNLAIENLKQGFPAAPEIHGNGSKLLFTLSPNDLVYIPTAEQLERGKISPEDIDANKDRIYKFISCTGNEGHFIPYNIASPIVQTTELGANNKSQRAWTGEMIKESCIKISVNRLGRIKDQ